MKGSVDPASSPARLHALLHERARVHGLFASAASAAVREARALGAASAAKVVTMILDSYEPGGDHETAERAADLAFVLRLTGAVPALVRCLERLSEYEPVAHAALRALERMPGDATEPLLAAFGRCGDRAGRAAMATALVRAGERTDAVRKALVSTLADDPMTGAGCLTELRDRHALPDLSAALDRLDFAPAGCGDDELHRCEEIVALVTAIATLRGALTPAQRAKFDRAWQRSGELLGLDIPTPQVETSAVA